MENRSKAILGMEDSAFARSLFKSMGYTDSELKEGKPLIGIANTWNTLVMLRCEKRHLCRRRHRCGVRHHRCLRWRGTGP